MSDDLKKLLHSAYSKRDDQLIKQYKRSLPIQDAADDRWERAKKLGFGEGTSIYNSAVIFCDVSVGKGTWIGPYVMLDGAGGGIEIGDTCSISAGVHIYTHDTIAWALSGGKKASRQAPVRIGSCTYIGSQSVIAAGVRVGSLCVIASNSFVNSDVEDNTIVGGTPAKRLGVVEMRDEEPVLVFDNGSVSFVADL